MPDNVHQQPTTEERPASEPTQKTVELIDELATEAVLYSDHECGVCMGEPECYLQQTRRIAILKICSELLRGEVVRPPREPNEEAVDEANVMDQCYYGTPIISFRERAFNVKETLLRLHDTGYRIARVDGLGPPREPQRESHEVVAVSWGPTEMCPGEQVTAIYVDGIINGVGAGDRIEYVRGQSRVDGLGPAPQPPKGSE